MMIGRPEQAAQHLDPILKTLAPECGSLPRTPGREDVLTASLYTRFRSRQEHTFAEKVLSAMRQKFGGHIERPAGG
jgi:6-phosphogluconate dehydrogenase (decarboxylating)